MTFNEALMRAKIIEIIEQYCECEPNIRCTYHDIIKEITEFILVP